MPSVSTPTVLTASASVLSYTRIDERMKPGRKAKRIGCSLLLIALCGLLVTMLPGPEALWAQ